MVAECSSSRRMAALGRALTGRPVESCRAGLMRVEWQQLSGLQPLVSKGQDGRFGRFPGTRMTAKTTTGVFAEAAARSQIPLCIGLADVASMPNDGIQS